MCFFPTHFLPSLVKILVLKKINFVITCEVGETQCMEKGKILHWSITPGTMVGPGCRNQTLAIKAEKYPKISFREQKNLNEKVIFFTYSFLLGPYKISFLGISEVGERR